MGLQDRLSEHGMILQNTQISLDYAVQSQHFKCF